jgi:hypothetical protein
MARFLSEELRRLDDQIATVERQLADLKAHRNNLVPFCQLPEEILAHVLYFAQVAPEGKKRHAVPTPWINFDCRWVEYTRICRRMREVALGTPSLWTFIECRSRKKPGKWAELCAERARNCLLEISGPGYHVTDNLFPKERVADIYVERARMMHFFPDEAVGGTAFYKAYEEILSAPLPVIQVLHCNMDFNTLPSRFLGGGSPSLTYLSLLRVCLGNTDCAPEFPALRYLEIELGYTLTSGGAEQFVLMLMNALSLETLVIHTHHRLDDSDCNANKSFASIPLPKLRTLHMDGVYEDMSLLVRIIPTPRKDLSIDFDFDKGWIGELDPDAYYNYLLRFLEGTASAGQHHSMGHINISSNGTGRFEFGHRFKPDTDGPIGVPRVYFCYFYQVGLSLLPHGLLETISSVSVFGDWDDHETNAFDDFGHSVRHVNVEQAEVFLPPDFDDWVSKRAEAGLPLEVLKFTRCGKSDVGGLFDYAENLRKEGKVKDMQWVI